MGRRKQKVRWCIVDGLKWTDGQQEGDNNSTDDSYTGEKGDRGVQRFEQGVPSRRSPGGGGWNSAVAPRFERKAALELAEQKVGGGGSSSTVYYEGEICEAEHLPNGFTKIRSKNLDILFKREYYEQRLASQQLRAASAELKDTTQTEDVKETEEETELTEKKDPAEGVDPSTEEMLAKKNDTVGNMSVGRSFDMIDPNDITEFKPMDSSRQENSMEPSGDSVDSGNSSPFYPSYPPVYSGPEYNGGPGYNQAPNRPNLYLYSPSNNTLIPCEEIIIPNPVMSPEGPVYSGPTNIYLAYPVTGPDGRGYLTQPFVPGQQGGPPGYMSQDSCSYSPSISCDGSNYYSSTPHTPNSGQDSGSSTQPTSPPPLVNYHPTNWVNQENNWVNQEPGQQPNNNNHLPPSFKEGNCRGQSYQQTEPVDSSNNYKRQQSIPSNKCPLPTEDKLSPGQQQTRHIPGLPPEVQNTAPKKSQKRRKKKPKAEIQNLASHEHRGSTSSDSEMQRLSPVIVVAPEENELVLLVPDVVPEQPVQMEIHLTDDLADSLVNPPTEESEDEKPTSPDVVKQSLDIVIQNNSILMEELENEDILAEEFEVKGLEVDSVEDKSSSILSEETHADIENNDALEDNEVEEITKTLEDVKDLSENPLEDVKDLSENPLLTPSLPEQEVVPIEEVNEPLIIEVNEKIPTEISVLIEDNQESVTTECENNLVEVDLNEKLVEQLSVGVKESDKDIIEAVSPTDDHSHAEVDNHELVANGENSKNQSRVRRRRPRQRGSKKMVQNTNNEIISESIQDTVDDKLTVESNITVDEKPKKSYSSVIKSNLVTEVNHNNSNNNFGASETKNSSREIVSSMILTISSPDVEQPNVLKVKEIGQVEKDEWMPVAQTQPKPQAWEKTSKKGRRNKQYNNNTTVETSQTKSVKFSEEEEALPDLETYTEEKAVEAVVVPPVPEENTVLEDNCNEEEAEQERKKGGRRRKKKFGSEDPEGGDAASRRVVICDQQIEIRHSRSVRRASEVLSNCQLDKVKTTGFCDFLVVSELGQGIGRGSMGLGRLYQGKYVPPERTDGLLHIEDGEDEEQLENEETAEKDEEEEATEATDAVNATSTDIDLD